MSLIWASLNTLPPYKGFSYHLMAQLLLICPLSRYWIQYKDHALCMHYPLKGRHGDHISRYLNDSNISEGLQPFSERITTITTMTTSYSYLNSLSVAILDSGDNLNCYNNGIYNSMVVAYEQLLNMFSKYIDHLQSTKVLAKFIETESTYLHKIKSFYITVTTITVNGTKLR